MSNPDSPKRYQRKYPRKHIRRTVGILCSGTYFLAEGVDVGEGGIGFRSELLLTMDQPVVVTFQIPRGAMIVVPAIIKNISNQGAVVTTGVAFINLTFSHKRQIRYFVSSRNESLASG